MICRKALIATIPHALATGLLAATGQVLAEEAPESAPLDVIELPAEQPKASRLSLNWGCDVLLIEDSRRFRAGHCPGDKPESEATELELETAEDSGSELPERRRKLMY